MSFSLGIIGRTNTGKTALFNAVTGGHATVSAHMFSTTEPHIGQVSVPDERLDRVSEIYRSRKTVAVDLCFVDVAGLVGASPGTGLGSECLSHIRDMDALLSVLRCFEDGVGADVNPVGEMETLQLELIQTDISMVEKSLQRRSARADKSVAAEVEVLKKIAERLGEGRPARSVPLSREEKERVKSHSFLTLKPLMYVANIPETEIGSPDPSYWTQLQSRAETDGARLFSVCAEVESQLAEFPAEEAAVFAEEMGIKDRATNRLIRASYDLVDRLTFFTAGEKESRAWTMERGLNACSAAGLIHSDLERGFIRAEVISYDDLIRHGSEKACKDSGSARVEDRDYVVQEADILTIRFNV